MGNVILRFAYYPLRQPIHAIGRSLLKCGFLRTINTQLESAIPRAHVSNTSDDVHVSRLAQTKWTIC